MAVILIVEDEVFIRQTYTFGVGGDAGEVGAVEDRALQRACLEERFFSLLARGIVGADQGPTLIRPIKNAEPRRYGSPHRLPRDSEHRDNLFDFDATLEKSGIQRHNSVIRVEFPNSNSLS
ncbi:hypothetical protein [Mesorhizobium comanense]|uniref:hypothetical protein n=1 Tax=Mesorhizobium comanense TaxID=2502215 RepID=UPI0010F781D6|nr:hypothetical protein [Mesorhizobium comanense]